MGQIKDGANVSKVEGIIIDESITVIFKFLYHYMFAQQSGSGKFLECFLIFFNLLRDMLYQECHILKNGMLKSIGSAMSFSVIRVLSIGNA